MAPAPSPRQLGAAFDLARWASDDTAILVAPPGAQPLSIGTLGSFTLAVTATEREADDYARELRFWYPDLAVAMLPAWETLPHERISPSADIVGERLDVLSRLDRHSDHPGGALDILVAPVRALQQPIPAETVAASPIVVVPGTELDPAGFAARAVEYGYERCDLVERRGQFAVRGGIVDVFAPTDEHPVRIELWGDTVEEVRTFAVTDQRAIGPRADPVRLVPVSEMLLTEQLRRRAAAAAQRHPEARAELDQLAAGTTVPGKEAFAPFLTDAMVPATHLLPDDRSVVVVEPDRVARRAQEAVDTAAEFAAAAWSAASVGAQTPLTPGAGDLLDWDDIRPSLAPSRALTAMRVPAGWDPGFAPVGPFARAEDGLAEIAERARSGWTVVVVASGAGPADRLAEVLADADVPVSRDPAKALEPRVVSVVRGRIATGFQCAERSLAVYADADLTRHPSTPLGERAGRREGSAKMPSRRRRQVDPLSLRPGDHIVHDKHGVGRFVELIHREVRGADREYLVVEYAPSRRGQPPDRLFIPTDQLAAVSRYIGGEEPKVNKLGGADWARAKGRAKKAVRQIAAELIRLYAARQAAPGYAFGPDTPWQRELEDAFEYTETPDQLACIDEVKADMQKPVPMDRLVCGDVGYGKTEIAVRAAFKAVQDAKQVAVLVPTTLLVQQHHATFTERFAGFPVQVAALSRFQTDSQAKDVLERLADGRLDVVIGTHRLLTAQVRFKDLGLVIVDEEQRFGVEHKEHLKALRANVDMLAMSATPIPRTLEMAVSGIREMSTIATPPEERLPVLTYVGAYDERQIAAAIHRELLRDGQVFFVHNRVESIDRTAARVGKLVPEARVAVAHGRMAEGQLERVVLDFWDGKIDVLVCTTIVESGLDIANANTLIVDRADTYGLSQLHQLRGRVGRSRTRAYAYFLHPSDRALSETAHERLATIAQNADLGSGMQVALKDLEIRGAGNLLGAEQSGHIAEVGFDLYIRMVGEALAEFKGEAVDGEAEIRIDLPVDAHLPEAYVPEQRLRLEAYRRLAEATSDDVIDDLAAELADRYGPLPEPVVAMIDVARFRLLARRAGLDEVVTIGERIRFHPVELPDSRRVRAARLYPGTIVKSAVRQLLVPAPTAPALPHSQRSREVPPAEGPRQPVTGRDALDWATRLVKTVLLNETDGSARA